MEGSANSARIWRCSPAPARHPLSRLTASHQVIRLNINTFEALWVVMVSRFIIFHRNEITYCNYLSVTGQQTWQREACELGRGEGERWKEGMKHGVLWLVSWMCETKSACFWWGTSVPHLWTATKHKWINDGGAVLGSKGGKARMEKRP